MNSPEHRHNEDEIYPPPDTFDTPNVTTEQPQSKDSLAPPNKTRRHSVRRSSRIGSIDSPLIDSHGKLILKNFEPKEMTCPKCHKHITTTLTYEAGDSSWSWCCCCILMGCILGCCLLPFYVDRFKDVIHNCPECHHQIALYPRNDPSNHRKV